MAGAILDVNRGTNFSSESVAAHVSGEHYVRWGEGRAGLR
jgi:hypothetical protein